MLDCLIFETRSVLSEEMSQHQSLTALLWIPDKQKLKSRHWYFMTEKIIYLVTLDLSHSILWLWCTAFERENVWCFIKPLLAVLRGCCRARLFGTDVFKAKILRHLYLASIFFIYFLPYISPGNYSYKTTLPTKEMLSVYPMKLKK